MEDLVANRDSYGFKLYHFCYKDIAVQCTRRCWKGDGDRKEYCALWDSCQGDLKRGKGFYPIETLIRKYKLLPKRV